MEKNYKIAVKFEINKGRIQLFDKNGNKLPGKGTRCEGDFYCFGNNLTSLEGAPESVGGGFYCYNNNLTSLAGAPESVGGGFYCSGNNLTSLAGAPESVGGGFYCSNNNLTSLAGAPKERQAMFSVFLSAGYVFADGILTRKKWQKKISAKITVYKTEKLGFKKNAPVVYIATDGKNFAHGKTIRLAAEELAFKTGKRDVSEFKNMKPDTKKTPEEWAFIYRQCTGSCQTGIDMFMARHKLKKSYTLAEILEATKGAYAHNAFKSVVCEAA